MMFIRHILPIGNLSNCTRFCMQNLHVKGRMSVGIVEQQEPLSRVSKIVHHIKLGKARTPVSTCSSSVMIHTESASKMSITQVSSNKTFGGEQRVYSHESSELGCTMKFGVYLPAEALAGTKLPVVVWLSGLTCTEQNFITKAGAQRVAAELKLIIVNPDTSPRGLNIEGEDDSYDFGSGAGFYVDATTEKWKKNYRMYSYVTKEFLSVIDSNFPTLPDKKSIFGHSMGGHGALVLALKNPGLFKTASAFAPISNPTQCPWGHKCFGGYLGEDKEAWKAYDATELVKSYDGPPLDILVDQGAADNFLSEKQLLPENLMQACKASNVPCVLRMQEGYDHSYYFIATFVEDHLKHHAKHLHQ